jgi:hypothetical protein
MQTVSVGAMASEVGISHTMLRRHVLRGIVRDDENGPLLWQNLL